MSGGTQTAPTPYQPPNQAGAASAFQTGASTIANIGSTTQAAAIPGYQQLLTAFQQNPYAAGAQTNANTTSATGMGVGNQQVGMASQLSALGGSLQQYAPGIAATAFDPQGQLYAQQQQQNQQQTAAINAMNGVGGSPYAAGLDALSNQNFNIGWGNNQQTRQLAGVQGIEGLAGATAGLDTAAANIGGQGLQTLTQAGDLPYAQYGANEAAIGTALNQLVAGDTAAAAPTQQSVADQGQYLNIGQTAAQGAIQAAQVNNQAAAQQAAGFGNLFGDVLGMFKFTIPGAP